MEKDAWGYKVTDDNTRILKVGLGTQPKFFLNKCFLLPFYVHITNQLEISVSNDFLCW